MSDNRNSQGPQLDRLIPVPEVISRLGVGRTMVYAALKSGALPSVKLGTRRLVPASGFQKYLEDLGVRLAP